MIAMRQRACTLDVQLRSVALTALVLAPVHRASPSPCPAQQRHPLRLLRAELAPLQTARLLLIPARCAARRRRGAWGLRTGFLRERFAPIAIAIAESDRRDRALTVLLTN